MTEHRLALDTNALRALIAEDEALVSVVGEAFPVIPVVVLQEATNGWILQAFKAEQQSREAHLGHALDRLAELYGFVRRINVLRYNEDAQTLYAALRTGRGNRSRRDLRIAAICLAHQVPLLTRNRSDFDDVEGLRLVEW
jgi:tRNA(fMet)-specific endonuclease VapC